MITDDHRERLDRDGYVILENFLTPAETEELRDRVVSLAEAEKEADGRFVYLDGRAQRVWNLINKGELFERVIQRPDLLSYMEYLLGVDVTLSSFTVNTIGPGAPGHKFHTDIPMIAKLPVPRPSFPFTANSMWFLDDFTTDNGATQIVPHSHQRLVDLPDEDANYDDAIQVVGPKGSVMIMNGGIWHRTGENRTEKERVALLGYFCRSFMKPQQNHLKIVRPEVFKRATPKLKQLLGCDSQPGEDP